MLFLELVAFSIWTWKISHYFLIKYYYMHIVLKRIYHNRLQLLDAVWSQYHQISCLKSTDHTLRYWHLEFYVGWFPVFRIIYFRVLTCWLELLSGSPLYPRINQNLWYYILISVSYLDNNESKINIYIMSLELKTLYIYKNNLGFFQRESRKNDN